MNTYVHLWHYLTEFFLEWEMIQTKFVEKIKTHILYSITFSRKLCRLWYNAEKYGTARQATDDNIIWCMRFACWITKATDTHSEYAIHTAFFTATMVTRRRLSITLHVHCLSCKFLVKEVFPCMETRKNSCPSRDSNPSRTEADCN
jgi:hypothetical protein